MVNDPSEAATAPARKDFFVSYTGVDRAWAEWISWQLEEAGYQTIIQAWDFLPGRNFVVEMDQATRLTERTIAVLTPDYFKSSFTPSEWQAAFRRDPTSADGRLLPVRVHACEVEGLLGSIGYLDLVDLDERTARERLLAGVRRARAKPSGTPAFPGGRLTQHAPAGPAPAFPGSASQPVQPWNIPYPRNPFFSARRDELAELRKQLRRKQSAAIGQSAAINGLGGVGKTQLAVEYAYRQRADYIAVLWVNAESLETLNASYSEIARLLALPEREDKEQERVVHAVRRWLETQPGYLLILDNLDEPAILFPQDEHGQARNTSPFLPTMPAGQLLITTRAADLSSLGVSVTRPLSLTTFTPEQGAHVLLTRAGLLEQTGTLAQVEQETRELALRIGQELGGLALALDQAGAYLAATGESLAGYLQLVQQRLAEILKQKRGRDYPRSVATTWMLSFERVGEQQPAAADLLRFCAFLAPDAIPEELLTKGAEELGETLAPVVVDALAYNAAIEALRAYSLLTRDSQACMLSVHRLVQAVLRASLSAEEQQSWQQRAIKAVAEAYPGADFVYWPEYERLLPHALLCASWMEQDATLATPVAANLLNQAGSYLHDRARYAEAEPLYAHALAIYEQAMGPDHPNTATSLNNLALLYRAQGRYEQAEPLHQRALAIYEQALGPDHPNTATSLNNLAALYADQGKYERAEPLYERALAIREQALGPDHPDTATSLNNLAGLYRAQGRYAQAEPLYERALAIYEQVLGLVHPVTATSLNDLALLYDNQGRYAQAEPLYERALAIREQALGPDHPAMATSLNNLAVLYKNQGKYEQAEPLYARALAIDEQVYGSEHPEIATDLNNLAGLYDKQGRYAEAEPLYQRTLAIWEQALGPQHPDTATILNNLALLYANQGKYEQAEPLYARALAIYEKTLGKEHPSTRIVQGNYTALLREMKRE